MEVTFVKGDKSIDSKFEQPSKNQLPIEMTLDKLNKTIVVKFVQPRKKLSPMRNKLFFDLYRYCLIWILSSFLDLSLHAGFSTLT